MPEILRIGKTIETESRLVVFKGWRKGRGKYRSSLERRKYSEIRIVNFEYKMENFMLQDFSFFLRKKVIGEHILLFYKNANSEYNHEEHTPLFIFHIVKSF